MTNYVGRGIFSVYNTGYNEYRHIVHEFRYHLVANVQNPKSMH